MKRMINMTVVLLNIQKHSSFAAALCIFAPVFIINITTFLFSDLPTVSLIPRSLIGHFTVFLKFPSISFVFCHFFNSTLNDVAGD